MSPLTEDEIATPERVMDFGITEMRIAPANVGRLPKETQEYLRIYGGRVDKDGFYVYRVPNYRVQEILDAHE